MSTSMSPLHDIKKTDRLMMAIIEDDIDQVKELIDAKDFDLHDIASNKLPPIEMAAMKKSEPICTLLLDAGVTNSTNRFPNLLFEVTWSYSLTKRLLNEGVDATALCDRGFGPAYSCAIHDAPETMRLLAGAGANLEGRNLLDSGQLTPLLRTAQRLRPAMVDCLIELGADACARNAFGCTALHLAVMTDGLAIRRGGMPQSFGSIARSLIDAGVSIDAVCGDGETALFKACAKLPMAPMVSILLAMGADPTIVDSLGMLPIEVARLNNNAEAVAALQAFDAHKVISRISRQPDTAAL